MHLGVKDFADELNSYPNSLAILKSARRNQLESQLRSLSLLNEIQGDLQSMEEDLRRFL